MGQFIRNRFEIPFLGRVTEEGTFHAMPSAKKKPPFHHVGGSLNSKEMISWV
jgi:hypothetical protein